MMIVASLCKLMIVRSFMVATLVVAVAAEDDPGREAGTDGSGVSAGDLMYSRRINNMCTTLQMIPGRNTTYEYTAETGDPSFLSYAYCQEKCTELGVSCLGFEFSLRTTTIVPSSPNQGGDSVGPTEEQEARCKFWNRLPVGFTAPNLSDGGYDEASCVVKEFVAFEDPGTCNAGFIPTPSSSSTYETLTDVSAVDCYYECLERSTVTESVPIFGVDNTTGLCYGVRYDGTNDECQLWDMSTFSVQDRNETSAVDVVATGGDNDEDFGDEDVCYVRSYTVLNDPSNQPEQGSYGDSVGAYNSTLTLPFLDEEAPEELYVFNPAVSGKTSCNGCDCMAQSAGNRYIWLRLQYAQPQRIGLSLDTFQPPMIYNVRVKQEGANLGVAIVQGQGSYSCIDGWEQGVSSVKCSRASDGFITVSSGEVSGSKEVYAIISTDKYELEDLSTTTGAGFTRGSGLRGLIGRNFTGDRLLQATASAFLQVGVSGQLQDRNCFDTLSCASTGYFNGTLLDGALVAAFDSVETEIPTDEPTLEPTLEPTDEPTDVCTCPCPCDGLRRDKRGLFSLDHFHGQNKQELEEDYYSFKHQRHLQGGPAPSESPTMEPSDTPAPTDTPSKTPTVAPSVTPTDVCFCPSPCDEPC